MNPKAYLLTGDYNHFVGMGFNDFLHLKGEILAVVVSDSYAIQTALPYHLHNLLGYFKGGLGKIYGLPEMGMEVKLQSFPLHLRTSQQR